MNIDFSQPFIIHRLVFKKETMTDGRDVVATIKDGLLIEYNRDDTITVFNLDAIERMIDVQQYII